LPPPPTLTRSCRQPWRSERRRARAR
jgi:hypothetical protein